MSVACWRCRKQKLRCTREQPECRRCMRANYACSYPIPPDRKRIALQRSQRAIGLTGSGLATPSEVLPTNHASPNLNQSRSGRESSLILSYDQREDSGLQRNPPQSVAASHSPVIDSANVQQPVLGGNDDVHLAEEVASFLIEIYFERHYQAELLFQKQRFIEDHVKQRPPSFVSLAIYAFASLFLAHTPGGRAHGDIDITSISNVDWCKIGERWAEQASQKALMNADKPCLENIQACQILAMFWLAKMETRRTNMHTAIAYRSCRLLQFHRPSSDCADQRQGDSDLKTRCFWACWLTRCASQTNAGFSSSCWTEVVDCPLPTDNTFRLMDDVKYFVNDAGSVHRGDLASIQSDLGLNASLVMIHGIWWEVQNFVYSMQQHPSSIHDPTSRMFALDERLQELYERMHDSIKYTPSFTSAFPNSTILSRVFSLNYIYHFCVCYLFSALVPLLSSGPRVPSLSKRIIRLAAEQACKHSSIMMDMAEDFLARKGVISKVWPMAGYGAYVCAAIQLRSLLALKSLSTERLGRCEMLLQITGELKKYWANLSTLHDCIEKQFLEARRYISADYSNRDKSVNSADELIEAIITPEASLTIDHPQASISTYIADDDCSVSSPSDKRQPCNSQQPASSPHVTANRADNVSQQAQIADSIYSVDLDQSWTEDQGASSAIQRNLQDSGSWWEQAPDTFGEIFQRDFLIFDNGCMSEF